MGDGVAMRVTNPTGYRWSAWRVLGALFILCIAAGCVASKESLLEKGESVDTGRREFDAYFEKVAVLRESVDKLDSDLYQLRQPITEQMDLDVDIPIGALMEETRKRIDRFRSYGILVTLRLTPIPKVLALKGSLEADDKDDADIKAIEESAVRAMQVFKEYSTLLDEASELESARAQLADRIDKLPPNIDKGRIETEIVGAGRVIKEAEAKLLRDTRTISHFLVGLAHVVDSGGSEDFDAKCEEAIVAVADGLKDKKKNEKKKARWRPRRGGKKPVGRPPTRPASKPPPKPAGGDDFEM